MKATLLFSILASGIMLSCGPKQSQPDESIPDSNADTRMDQPASQPDTTDPFEKSARLPIPKANTEIDDFLKNPTLKKWAKRYALGGTFEKIDDFFPKHLTDTDIGVMMWYTFDSSSVSPHPQPRIVLAIESWHRWNNQPYKTPQDTILTYPDWVFTHQSSSGQSFLLKNHKNLNKHNLVKKVRKEVVENKMKHFDELNRRSESTRHPKPFNEDYGAFFQNNPDSLETTNKTGLLTRLVNQPNATGVRYYFALKPDEKKNLVRIILVAIDKDGNNITEVKTKDANGKIETEPAVVVQKSIPPGGKKPTPR